MKAGSRLALAEEARCCFGSGWYDFASDEGIEGRCQKGHAEQKQRKVKALGLGQKPAPNSEAAAVKIRYWSPQSPGLCRR